MLPTYYKHSGEVPAIAIMVVLVDANLCFIPLSWLYAMCLVLIPIAKLQALILVGYAVLVSYLGKYMVLHAKVRHLGMSRVSGAVIGLVALYWAWVFWTRTHNPEGHIFLDPVQIFELMRQVAENTGSEPSDAYELWGGWLLEALTLVAMPCFLMGTGMAAEYFCEACDVWARKMTAVGPYDAPDDIGVFYNEIQREGTQKLLQLPPLSDGAVQQISGEILSCEFCDKLHVLTMEVTPVIASKENGPLRLFTGMLLTKAEKDALVQG